MSAGGFFIRSAINNLRRGGQRTLVAFLCVAFGVMSLVAMTTMSKSIERVWALEPHERIGGDLTIGRTKEDVVSADHEAQLKQMQSAGQIDNYTMMDYSTTLTFHLPSSGELIFPSVGMGVNAGEYPLAGKLTIREPKNGMLTDLIAQPGDVVITRDVALTYHLKVGDTIILSDLNFGRPLEGKVRGIASDTPNHQGSKVYYSHESANLISGLERSANTVLVNSRDPNEAMKLLKASGWDVFTAKDLANIATATESSMAMGLNDIGLMGVLVGGIGIANTMQVLLRRRRKEVAIWKTLGYSSGRIQTMFVFEAALLGLIGSLVGAGLGVLLSYKLTDLFSRTTTYLVPWAFSPAQAVAGIVIGVLITVIFATWAIVSTSRVRPLALLRNEVLDTSQLPFVQGIGLGLLLAVPFMAIAAWILRSFWIGMIVLFVSVLGLAALGFGLWGLVWLVTKLMPMKGWPLGRISRNNLRRRGPELIFAMVALFIGVISLGLGAVITQSGKRLIGAVNGPASQENLAIYASAMEEGNVNQTIQSIQVNQYTISHQYQAKSISSKKSPEKDYSNFLEGRSEPGSYSVHGADWGSNPDGVYVREYMDIPVGSKLLVTKMDGTTLELEVVGNFSTSDQASWPGGGSYFLVADDLGKQISAAENVHFYLQVPPQLISQFAASIGKALPQATVISLPEYQATFVRQFQNLFVFAATMAGLAILAGILLIANSVSLSMLERRYEIGVLKAVGYSRWQVLFTQVVEYTLVAIIVSLVGLGMIWAFLGVVSLTDSMVGALLVLEPATAAWIAALTIGLTLLTVLLVTWRPTNVSPVFVLNDRE